MKLNKKGFTLIELLAVVVLLLAISVVAVSSISAAIERNKNKQNDTKKSIIVSYAELYYNEHKNSYSSLSDFCVDVQTLVDIDYLSNDEAKDVDGDRFQGVVKYSEEKKFYFEDYDNSDSNNIKGICN